MIALKRDETGLWVSPGGDVWFEARECPVCFGTGVVEIDVPRPHSPTRDVGVIDVGVGSCQECEGLGAIVKEDENDE